MKTAVTGAAIVGTSVPTDHGGGTGGGSIVASMISRGVAVSRYTAQGTIRPFGQDIGTADDVSALTHVPNVSGCEVS